MSTLLSCAFTAEPAPPAPPPCVLYIGVQGDLASCGIPDGPGPLSADICLAQGCAGECALLADAGSLGFGPTVIGCGCP